MASECVRAETGARQENDSDEPPQGRQATGPGPFDMTVCQKPGCEARRGALRSTSPQGNNGRLRPVRWWILASLLSLLALQTARADLDIEAKNGMLTVRARGVPLAQLLDRLSHETGMKLTYDGRRPSQLMTVTIERSSESAALLQILEGLGLNYALEMDATGRRVETLVISESPSPSPLATSNRAPSPTQAFVQQAPEPEVEESTDPQEDQPPNFPEANQPSAGRGASQDNLPAPVPTPLSPAYPPPGFWSPSIQAPSFPAPASNPIPAGGALSPPGLPIGASNPAPPGAS
jgi:hypothetical protein